MAARRRGRRRLPRVAACLVVAVGMLLTTAGSAAALPGIPDCKNPPALTSAGSGVSGMLDPAPARPAASTSTPPPATPAAPAAAAAGTPGPGASVYADYGYAGMRWSTYDLGCLGGVADPGADIDTLVGNWGLSLSVFLVSLSNGLHARVVDPSWLAPLDDVTASVTKTVHDVFWAPWGAVALLGVTVTLLLYSVRGQLSDTLMGAAWALLVLTVLAGVVNYPQLAGQYYDQAVIGTLSSLDTGAPPGSATTPAAKVQAHGALLVDKVLYQAWLRGEVGTATGAAATTWGSALFKEQALSYSEVAAAQADPAKRTALEDAKGSAFKDTAQQIQDGDPGVYAALQGRAGGRTAAGALALFAAATTTLFRIVADLFLAAGLVMLRILVMFFPAVAVLGVMVAFSGLVRRLANAAGAAVINVIAFGAASMLHTTIVTAALGRVDDGLGWMALVLCLLVTIILFVLCLPLLSLTSLAGISGRSSGLAGVGMRGVARRAGYLVGRRRPAAAPPPADPAAASPDGGPRYVVVDLSRLRQDEQTPADEPVGDDDPPPRVWVTPRRPVRPEPARLAPAHSGPPPAALPAGSPPPTAEALPGRAVPRALPPVPQRDPDPLAPLRPAPPAPPLVVSAAVDDDRDGVLEGRIVGQRRGWDLREPVPVGGERTFDELWHAANFDSTDTADSLPVAWDPRTARAGR